MSKLLSVAEAIIDGAASEWFEENTKCNQSVEDYAMIGMGISLTSDESGLVRRACLVGKEDYWSMVELLKGE